jgi:hypothetical protein
MINLLTLYGSCGNGVIIKIESMFSIEKKYLTPENKEFNEYIELICLYTTRTIDFSILHHCDLDLIFMFAFDNKNTFVIEQLLNNKYIPSTDVFSYLVLKYFANKDFEYSKHIFVLFYNYGIQPTNKDYIILGWIEYLLHSAGYVIPDDLKTQFTKLLLYENFNLDELLYQNQKSYNVANNMCYSSYHTLKLNLRNNFINNTNCNNNCVLNYYNPIVFEYMHKKHNYIPSIMDIMKINIYRVRIIYLIRFYPDFAHLEF